MSETSMDLGAAAAQVVSDALEEIAFLATERMPPEGSRPDDSAVLWAAIPAHGAPFERLTLFAQEPVARRVTAIAFGIEPGEVNQAQIFDALAEMANTACGSLARALGAPNDHGLGLPESGRGLPAVKGQLLATEILDLEGEWFGVRVEG